MVDESKLSLEKEQMKELMCTVAEYVSEESSAGIVVVDRDFSILWHSKGFSKLLGLPSVTGKKFTEFLNREGKMDIPRPKEGEITKTRINLVSSSEIPVTMSAGIWVQSDWLVIFLERPLISESSILNEMSKLNNELVDLTRELNKKNREIEQANAKITALMNTDYLTSIPNRRFFIQMLTKTISYSKRHEMPLSLIMADLVHFKDINDRFGHETGDKALIAFAQLMVDSVRKEDTVARLGGEEFVILCPNVCVVEAVQCADRIRKVLKEMKIINSHQASITASFGVAVYEQGDTEDDLLRRADKALYKAKEGGRDRVERY